MAVADDQRQPRQRGSRRSIGLQEPQRRIVAAPVPQHMKVTRQDHTGKTQFGAVRSASGSRLHRARPRLPGDGSAPTPPPTSEALQSSGVSASSGRRGRHGRRTSADGHAQYRAAARMGVLHVEHRVLPGLRDHGMSRSKSNCASDLRVSIVKRTASRPTQSSRSRQRDVGAGALAHAHGLAVLDDADDLAQARSPAAAWALRARRLGPPPSCARRSRHGPRPTRRSSARRGPRTRCGRPCRHGRRCRWRSRCCTRPTCAAARSMSSPNRVERNSICSRASQSSGSLPFGGSSVPW